MTNYRDLLDIYSASYVPGEKRFTRQEKVHKQKQRLREKHVIADELFGEIKLLFFTPYQKEHVHYLIDKFQNFRKLHGNCSNEVIILAFIFYIAKLNMPRLKLSNYSITTKYGLTDEIFELIICRIMEALLKESFIVPDTTTKYDHEMLCKYGGKI